jgi:hypothetical protein
MGRKVMISAQGLQLASQETPGAATFTVVNDLQNSEAFPHCRRSTSALGPIGHA